MAGLTRGRKWGLAAALAVVAIAAAGCGGGRDDDEASDTGSGGDTSAATSSDLSGTIQVDGSSTVGPLVTLGAEKFQEANPDVQVTVGISGTGGGFERFCAGETDISNASRQIEDDEKAACEQNGVEYAEVQVANDGIAIVVNPENEWAECLTTAQLKQIWEPDSSVGNWNEVESSWADQDMKLFGPGTDSGTFDYFTDAINGEEGASRTDYQATEDDNVIVEGVSGEKGGLGYFGLSYAEANTDEVKLVQVDGGSGCVTPSTETVQSGEYTPLSRPLFFYVKKESLTRPEVAGFAHYLVDNSESIATEAKFVPVTSEQETQAKDALTAAGA